MPAAALHSPLPRLPECEIFRFFPPLKYWKMRLCGAGRPMGRLTTHVLNTMTGRPASGLRLELYGLDPETRLLKAAATNIDGRVDAPLLTDGEFKEGMYELRFFVGDYFRHHGVPLTKPAFLEVIPIRFGIAEPQSHYHVPLLLSPFGYSTYRGS
jgi:5-hydroxyisourate hydrolase